VPESTLPKGTYSPVTGPESNQMPQYVLPTSLQNHATTHLNAE
jgi:hypothetical protein